MVSRAAVNGLIEGSSPSPSAILPSDWLTTVFFAKPVGVVQVHGVGPFRSSVKVARLTVNEYSPGASPGSGADVNLMDGEAKKRIGAAMSDVIRDRIRVAGAKRFSTPLCESVLHDTLIQNGKKLCPSCGVRLLVK
jgi:hypothetical protein